MTTPLSLPNLTTFEQDHSARGGLADRVKLALRVPDTRDKVVNYYSKLLRWSADHKRAAKDAATDLFDKLSSLEPPSDHLAHLLAALARTNSDGALVQDIEKATGILRRAEKDSANNDGLHYYNGSNLASPGGGPANTSPSNASPPSETLVVCIVCAIKLEADAVIAVFRKNNVEKDITLSQDVTTTTNKQPYTRIEFSDNKNMPVQVNVLSCGDMGADIQLTLSAFLQAVNPHFAIMTGVMAGKKEENIRLGDLIIADVVVSVVGKHRPDEWQSSSLVIKLPPKVVTSIHGLVPNEADDEILNNWPAILARAGQFPISDEKSSDAAVTRSPVPRIGTVAGFIDGVHADMEAVWWERLRHVHRSVIGMEMESGVFAKTVDAHNANRIVGRPTLLLFVKGVMDHGSVNKDDRFKKYAARLSASFAFEFIYYQARALQL